MATLDPESVQKLGSAVASAGKETGKVIKDEVADSLKPVFNTLLEPLTTIKSGIMGLPGVAVTKKLFSAVTKPLQASFSADQSTNAKEQVAINDQARQDAKNETLMEDIRDGIMGIQKGLIEGLAGLKDKGLMGLGILAGLIAAPFAALVAFFTQLGIEVKALGKILGIGGDKIKGILKPIGDIFTRIKNSKFLANVDDFLKGIRNAFSTKFTAFGTAIKNNKVFMAIDDIIARFSGVGTKIANAAKVTGGIIKKFTILDQIESVIRGLFAPIRSGLTAIKTGADSMKAFMVGFEPIMKFAKAIGSTLGKIFLPITILMSAFDFVTGFMDGYDEGGVLGGLEGGITKLFKGLIGMPLDLLKSGVGHILGFFGFDKAKEAIDKFSFSNLIEKLIGSIFSGLKGTFKFLTDLFDFSDLSIFSVFSKLIDIVFLPLNLAINFVKDLFKFGDPDEPFSLGGLVMQTINDIYEWFKGLLNIDIGKIVESIPGASTVLKALGVIDETQSDLEAKIAEAQDRIARSESGENVYFGREGKGREEDAEEILQLQKELADMRAQQGAGGGTTIVNNYSSSASSNSTTVTTQSLQDAAVATGSTMN